MKYCWRVTKNERNFVAPMLLLLLTMSVMDICTHMQQSTDPLKYGVVATIILSLVLLYPTLVAILNFRKYSVTKGGLVLHYPMGIRKSYQWDSFSEIGLCKVHYASASTAHKLAIRCVVGSERRGPMHAVVGKERWAKMSYEAFRFWKVITIYYSEDRYNEFIAYCPKKIIDYTYLEDRP